MLDDTAELFQLLNRLKVSGSSDRGLSATIGPARRAAKVDPLQAIRE